MTCHSGNRNLAFWTSGKHATNEVACSNCHSIHGKNLAPTINKFVTTFLPNQADICANCHQPRNVPGLHQPPGDPNWRLPEPAMPLVFEGRSARELALQLVDRARNGGRSLEQLLHHVGHDSLVLWGWAPGDGRMTPPLPHAEFVAAMRRWIETGAVAPD